SMIEDLHCRLSSFDAAMDLLVAQGKGAMLSKIDIASAYKCIPVRPADFALLGLHWEGKFYFDKTLPFGLSSSCAIWERYATAAEWAVLHNTSVRRLCHYIDDFLLISDKKAAASELKQLLDLFRRLGLPVSMEKLEGPVTSLIFLGIQVDSLSMTASLSSDRLKQLQEQAEVWATRSSCTRRELQSWVGLLSFAAKVVRPGRTFTRHAFTLLSATHHMRKGARISLSSGFTSDMRWWRDFLPRWNGVGLLYDVAWSSSATLQLWTDASTLGYGAVFQRQWFSCAWSDEERAQATAAKRESMPWMELWCITRAAATWGQHWRGRKVTFHCDAMTVVGAVHARTSASEPIMQLLRSLFFVSAVCGFEFRVLHTPGIANTLADPLSRLQIDLFKQRFPAAEPYPTTPLAVPTPSF
ncbi:MAG: reverse transcriptase domain-containing protein, partial [Alphaproteobacteria bacterium]